MRIVARSTRHSSGRFAIASRLQEAITCVVDLHAVVRSRAGTLEIELILRQRLSGAKGKYGPTGIPEGIGNALRRRFQVALETDFELALRGDSRRIQNIASHRARAVRLRRTVATAAIDSRRFQACGMAEQARCGNFTTKIEVIRAVVAR